MAINLKNYTTEIPADRSISYIEKLLVDFGATNIMKEYGPAGKCEAISFLVAMDNMKLPFRLPGKVQCVFVWLKKRKPQTKDATLLQQAERITWKQMHEWVHLQLSLIELSQLEKLEAFLPYIYDMNKRQTFFEQLKEQKFKALLPG
jgi:hypothetical protein